MPTIRRQKVDRSAFNQDLKLPFQLRQEDFELAIQDVYDFFHDVNDNLVGKGIQRLEDLLDKRRATLSGLISDFITASMATHARSLTENTWPNGHPDLLVKGRYPNDGVQNGEEGVEVKSTTKRVGAVDIHGALYLLLCVFVYEIDTKTQPARDRYPLTFTEIYLGYVTRADFRKNPRGELGTRTATLHRDGIARFRQSWLYLSKKPPR